MTMTANTHSSAEQEKRRASLISVLAVLGLIVLKILSQEFKADHHRG